MAAFADDVRAGRFPADDESYHLSDEVRRALGDLGSMVSPARTAPNHVPPDRLASAG